MSNEPTRTEGTPARAVGDQGRAETSQVRVGVGGVSRSGFVRGHHGSQRRLAQSLIVRKHEVARDAKDMLDIATQELLGKVSSDGGHGGL